MSPQHANWYPQPIVFYSTIFKTFDSKIDKWTSKIGLFGKSFNELRTAVNDAFKSVIDNLDNFNENVEFGESLRNNLFSKKDNIKNWKTNSLGEIISQENIDSYIAELDLDSAKEKLENMFDWDSKIKNNKATWQDYFETLDDGEGYIAELIKNTNDLSKLTGEDLVNANRQARTSVLAHNEAIKSQTFSAKTGKVVLQALAMAGNMIAIWVIGKFIGWVDGLIHSSERYNLQTSRHSCANSNWTNSTISSRISPTNSTCVTTRRALSTNRSPSLKRPDS